MQSKTFHFSSTPIISRWLLGDPGEDEAAQKKAAEEKAAADKKAAGGPDVATQIATAVEAATAGLKKNRDDVLAEKKVLADQMKVLNDQVTTLGGADGIKVLLETREKLQGDEMGKLLADGKYDEWYDQRTAAMRTDHQNQLNALTTKMEEAVEGRSQAEARWNDTILETEIRAACSKAGVVDSAVQDAHYHAKALFVHDVDTSTFLIKDKAGGTVIGKDGTTPKSMTEWLEEQKEVCRHWWPPSEGAGANGNLNGAPGAPNQEAIAKMGMPEYRKFRETQGMGQRPSGIPG